MILSLEIIREVAHLEGKNVGGVGVPLSYFRKRYGIPKSTFYRHVDCLISLEIISRLGRDDYTIHDKHYDNVVRSKMDSEGKIQRILFV